MVQSRATRVGVRVALAAFLLLGAATPVAASEITAVVLRSSPLDVTIGKPVAFPVTVQNTGGNTLNSIVVTGQAAPGFTFLRSTPASACSQSQPVCNFKQLRSGAPTPQITFYYLVPMAPATYQFKVQVQAAEGGNDNSDDTANNTDTFFSNTIQTVVRAYNQDFVAGHSLALGRTFSTGGIDCAGAGLPATCNDATFLLDGNNRHGTAVTMPVDGEVTASDVAPADNCPAAIATCFGHGSKLSVAGGVDVPGGITVTMRWDSTDLPSGMTPQKLDVIHLFDPPKLVGGLPYALITDKCTSTNQMNCFVVEPFKLPDKDIQATFKIPFNGVSKGW